MIECKIEETVLDITPQMERAAYNVIRQACRQHKYCNDCGIRTKGICHAMNGGVPETWPDLEDEHDMGTSEWKERMLQVFNRG